MEETKKIEKTKFSTSVELRNRVKLYCFKHGLKQYYFVNQVLTEALDKLERSENEKGS